jgi:hypothetical protein
MLSARDTSLKITKRRLFIIYVYENPLASMTLEVEIERWNFSGNLAAAVVCSGERMSGFECNI